MASYIIDLYVCYYISTQTGSDYSVETMKVLHYLKENAAYLSFNYLRRIAFGHPFLLAF